MKTFKSAILAGICIALGGVVNLKTGGIIGAVLFAFGLLTVVSFKYRLYTGTAGFIDMKKSSEWLDLGLIILGNIVGCGLVALMVHYALPECVTGATGILSARLDRGIAECSVLGIACGFVMTAAVKFARKGSYLPLLFGVPLFIMSGFTHSIADAFYYLAADVTEVKGATVWNVGLLYIGIVIGNFIGCNLYRFLLPEEE